MIWSLLYLPFIIGSAICISSALIGVILFYQNKLLMGETLSHAIYPAVIVGLMFSYSLTASVLAGIAIYYICQWLIAKKKLYPDTTFALILSSFFGLGLLLASYIQYSNSDLYQKIKLYLINGFLTTVSSKDLSTYLALFFVTVLIIILLYEQIKATLFDPTYAANIGVNVSLVHFCIVVMLVFSIVLSIKTVGVVMVSSMIVSPVLFAVNFSKNLKNLFLISSLFSVVVMAVALLINLLSTFYEVQLPLGSTIALLASVSSLTTLFIFHYKKISFREDIELNILKLVAGDELSEELIKSKYNEDILNELVSKRLISNCEGKYFLTSLGKDRMRESL